MLEAQVARYRELNPERADEFLVKGYKARHVFPHRIYYFPKCGPDGFKLAQRMCGPCRVDELWEMVLYAHPARLTQFPEGLFFDDDLVWHQQQFGKAGQVATANFVLKGKKLYSMVHISDVVQRTARRQEYRSRIQNAFKGWNHMLLNGVLNFAVEHNVQTVYTPTADLAHRHTDPARTVGRALFARVYDHHVHQLFNADEASEWWAIDVRENLARLVLPETKREEINPEKTICLCHDVERGFGHLETDPAFAQLANATAPQSLDGMLRIEKQLGVKATYNVLGLILSEIREKIAGDGHCVGFHSYDHQNLEHSPQLPLCRRVDYRIKGYRPPQSKITTELSDENLCFHNFEWLASSAYSLQIRAPELRNCLVKIPIAFDDFALYREQMAYEEWEQKALETIRQNDFIAFSLHDCYAPFWLPRYAQLLEKVGALGKLKTLNEVMSETVLSHAQ